MTASDSALLAQLPALAFAFALLLCRTGAACMLIPGIGEAEVPVTIRAAFAAGLVLLLLPSLAPAMPAATANVWYDAGLVLAELVSGLFLGWLARLVLLALPLAGQFIAMLTGQASVLQPDAVLGGQGTAMGKLLALAAPVLLFATGLHRLPLAAIAGSYSVILPGRMLPPADTVQAVVAAVAAMFALAVRLAAPFIVASIVWHAALAAVARLVPQIQVYFIAAPATLLGGLLLLGLLATPLTRVWQDAVSGAFAGLPGL